MNNDGIFYIYVYPIPNPLIRDIRFHEFRSDRSQREKIGTGASLTKNHLTRTTEGRPECGEWMAHRGWKEGKKETFSSSVFYFHRVNFFPFRGVIRFWSIEVASFFRSSDGKCVSADPDPEEQNDARKMGKRLSYEHTANNYHRKIQGCWITLCQGNFRILENTSDRTNISCTSRPYFFP